MYLQESLSTTSVTLTWTPGFDGGLRQTFVIEHKEISAKEWTNHTVNQAENFTMSYTLVGLKPETENKAGIYVFNAIGGTKGPYILTFVTYPEEGIVILFLS